MNNFFSSPIETARSAFSNILREEEVTLRDPVQEHIDPEVLAQQAILRQFTNRFGIAGNLLDPKVPLNQIEARASWAAYTMVDEGIVEEGSLVELRPLLPEDALRNHQLNQRREVVIGKLRQILALEYDISAIPNNHPIMPTEREDSPADITKTWRIITSELDGFSHQMDNNVRQLAMLAVSESDYVKKVFSGQPILESDSIDQGEILVLRHVGWQPNENVLLGSRKTGVLESRELQDLRTNVDES